MTGKDKFSSNVPFCCSECNELCAVSNFPVCVELIFVRWRWGMHGF